MELSRGLALLIAFCALLALACSQEEETLTSEPSETGTASPVTPDLTIAPSAGSSSSPVATELAGCPQVFPTMTMKLTGPPEAAPGQDVTYQLEYTLTGTKSTAVVFSWNDPRGANLQSDVTYVRSQRLEGEGPASAAARLIDDRIWEVQWGAREGSGRVEVSLRIPENPQFNSLIIGAYVTGTCAPGSNPVVTTIIP